MKASRIRDFVLYVAIGLSLVLSVIFFAKRNLDVKWLGLMFVTCCVFGSTIGALKRFWRIPIFWITLGICFIAHLAGFVLVLRQVHQWRGATAGLIFVVETAALTALCELVAWRSRAHGWVRSESYLVSAQ